MSDGSIKFDVKLDTDEFCSDLKNMAKNSAKALELIDDAFSSGAVSGLKTLDSVFSSAFGKLIDFSEDEKNFLLNFSDSALKSEEERQKEISKIREKAAAEELRQLTEEERIKQEMIEREYSQLKNSLNLGLISQEEYYLNLKDFRDKYFDVGSKEWEDYTIEILTYCKKTAESVADTQKKAILGVFEDMHKEVDEAFDDLEKTEEKLGNKLKDYGNLYTKKSFTSSSSGNTYSWLALGDIENDISVLKNYNNALKKAKDLLYKVFAVAGDGISAETASDNKKYIRNFFNELAEMSVEEGLTFSSFLTRLPQKDAYAYLSSWAKKQNLSAEIAKNLYSDEAMELYNAGIDNMAKEMITKLEESFGDLPDNFFDEGVASALGFGDGFIQSLKGVFDNIRTHLNSEFVKIMPSSGITSLPGNTIVENSTSYNIYGNSSPQSTALEIYKQDQLKRMLVGDYK